MADQIQTPNTESNEIANDTPALLKKEIEITSNNQSGGQTANSITNNINHHYPSNLEEDTATQEVEIVFDKSEPFLENTFHSEKGISKRMRIMVETQSNKPLSLGAFFVLDEKPLLDIPLRLKDSDLATSFLVYPGSRQFVDVAEYLAENKTLRFFSLPPHYQNCVFKLEEETKVNFTIKIIGDIRPYSKRFAFYINKEGFQVEEVVIDDD